MTDGLRFIADATLAPMLKRCFVGWAAESWNVVESLSTDVDVLKGWISRKPVALLVDCRSHKSVDTIRSHSQSSNKLIENVLLSAAAGTDVSRVIVVVEALGSAQSYRLTACGFQIVASDDLGNGRLDLILSLCVSAVDTQGMSEQSSHRQLSTAPDAQAAKVKAAESLNRLAIEMINRVDLQSLLQHIADSTSVLTNADYSYVALVHSSGDYLETIAANSESREQKPVKHRKGEGIGGQAWMTGETVCEPNYQFYRHRLLGLANARQACSVPLKLGTKVIGVIGILYENDDSCIEAQVETLETFAPLASVAIDNATLHEQNRLELARTEAISEISRAIYGVSSFDTIIKRICTTLIETFDTCKAHIYRVETDGTYMPLAAWEKVNDRIVPSKQVGAEMVARSVASWCIENQESALIKRGVNDKRESTDVHRMRARWRLGSTICLPLFHDDKSWGVLFAHRYIDRSDFTGCELKQFELIAAQISMALLRRELMVKVEHQAYHDSLTGLPNRWKFEALLEKSIECAGSSDLCFAVLFIDLDGFKSVDDSYGHNVGDHLLKQVANIIAAQLDSDDVLARMGGNEFSLLVSSRNSRHEIVELAGRIRDRLSDTVEFDSFRVSVGANVGISFYSDDCRSPDELLKQADFALYHAKNSGGDGVSIFNHSLLKDHQSRVQMELDMRRALDCGEFELHYQPKVNSITETVDGVEALIRWTHPTLGFIPPSDFIPVAERCGLIEEMGAWVLDQACRQGVKFRSNGNPLSVAVNISARQFNVEDFVQIVFSTLQKHKMPAECLELEVTESVVMQDIEMVVEKLAQLRRAGVTIAIDDFGTGYSSLRYLAELPLDVLKIDKSFIDKIENQEGEQLLIKTILTMSRELNLKTVAEGVETETQKKVLLQLGCDSLQGYFYSKPVATSQLAGAIDDINQSSLSQEAA